MKREKYQNINSLNILNKQNLKYIEAMKSDRVIVYMATSKDNKIDYFCIGENKKVVVCFVESCDGDMFKFKYNIFNETKEKIFKRRTTAQRYALAFCKNYVKANFIRE